MNNVIHNLTDFIKYTPFSKQGVYNEKYSIVLLHQDGSDYKLWDYYKASVSEKLYWKNNGWIQETNTSKINFQKKLSKDTTVFSFTRPTDVLNIALFLNVGAEYNKFFVPRKESDIDPKNYSKYMKKLLEYHDIKSPYVIMGSSQGAIEAMAFVSYYPKLVRSIFLIDPIGMNLNDELGTQAELLRGNPQFIKDLKNDIKIPNINSISKITVNNFRKNIIKNNYNFEKTRGTDPTALEILDNNIFMIKSRAFWNRVGWGDNHKITIIWSAGRDDNLKKVKESFDKKIKKYNPDTTILKWKAPHQMERTISTKLSQFIIDNL